MEKADEIIEKQAKKIPDNADEWIEGWMRFGFAAKGVIYFLIGVFAAIGAFRFGAQTSGTKEIFLTILRQPFGQILIVILALGLFGYAAWRVIGAVRNRRDRNIFIRILFVIIAVFYCGLGIYALYLAFSGNGASASGSGTERHITSALLSNGFGQIALALVGLGFVGAGIYQIYKGLTDEYRKCLSESEMSETMRTVAVISGRVGLSARGIVFILIGVFLNFAAYYARQDEIVGVSGALDIIARQSYGNYLMGIVAAGLILYGINMFVMARYRRMEMD